MPLLAVAERLKHHHSDCVTVYVGERNGKFAKVVNDTVLFDERYRVFAGKFRRYHGLSWWQKVFDIKTLLLNIRDVFYVVLGFVQAWWLLGRVQPDVVFLKGGFVGVPVGLAAALRRIPIVTHDSDAIPGLANRLVSRWTAVHAVALPPDTYQYPKSKVVQVGVLVEPAYVPVASATMRKYREQLTIPPKSTVLLVTGGSQGAVAINKAVSAIAGTLLNEFPHLFIVHQVGKGKQRTYGTYQHDRLKVLEFLQPMYVYMGAADVVVARGSANTIAELGVQGKAAVVVPSPFLAGGHQLKNAQVLQKQGSALVVEESALSDPKDGLLPVLRSLIMSPSRRQVLAEALQQATIVDAADRMSKLLDEQAAESGGKQK